jgi:hypothetical protein
MKRKVAAMDVHPTVLLQSEPNITVDALILTNLTSSVVDEVPSGSKRIWPAAVLLAGLALNLLWLSFLAWQVAGLVVGMAVGPRSSV